MNIKTAAIALFSFILGIVLMRGLDALEPEKTHDDSILIKTLEQRDEEIKGLKSDNKKLSILASKENDTVETIKKIYVPIQNEINRGNPVRLDSMFNVILSE